MTSLIRLQFTSAGRSRLQALTWLVVLSSAQRMWAQSEALPCVDPAVTKLQAGTPKAGAHFGFSMAAGKLGGISDANDDLVVCAPQEPEGSIPGVGAAWIFEDETLDAPASNFRLLPTLNSSGLSQNMGLGERAIEIANLRGQDASSQARDNLILIACYNRAAEYDCDSVALGGSVEMYDYNAAGAGPVPKRSVFAPPNPDVDGCPDTTPSEVKGFGHALAVADISRDGIQDLIVGAINTTGKVPQTNEDIPNRGRFYILLGHADSPNHEDDFWDDPWNAWLGVNAPESADPEISWGGHFAALIATANLSGESAADVIVGRPDDDVTASPCPQQPPASPDDCPPQGGSVYIFRGQWLHDQFDGDPYDPGTGIGSWNRVIDPPHPDPDLVGQSGGLDATYPEYQVLRNPFGDIQPDGSNPRYPLWANWFGWFVFNGGDCGSPYDGELEGGLDEVDDLLVHSESAAFIGNGLADSPQVEHCGALFLYHGLGGPASPDIVDPRPHLLQRPINVENGIPNGGSRIGRHFARADAWYDCTTSQTGPALFIAEPDSDWNSVADAGIVNMIRLPLPAPTSSDWWVPLPIVNAWGSTPRTEPSSSVSGENGPAHTFGAWIVTLDYKNNPAFPGMQVVISARQAAVRVGPGSHELLPGAGRVFPFPPRTTPCEPCED